MDLPCSKDDASDENTSHLMQLATLGTLPMTLKAAIELDVFEIIAKEGPGAYLSPADIVAHLPTQNTEPPAMLDRMLCLLASYSILSCSVDVLEGSGGRVERRYGLAPVSTYLVKNEGGVSVAPLALLSNHDKVFMESWQPKLLFPIHDNDKMKMKIP